MSNDASSGPVIAFAGPCLPRRPDARWRAALEGVELRPPARRGDILRALSQRPRALVLLDGLYYSVPSVTHKELLYAIDSGVLVVGAASMGALRAAEMEAFGMVGLGRVFELFQSGELDGDDEVAMLHTLAEDGYRTITLALVEVRQALAEEEACDEEGTCAFIDAAKALPFTERSARRLLDLLERHRPDLDGQALLARIGERGIKQQDALLALEWVRDHASAAVTQPAKSRPAKSRPATSRPATSGHDAPLVTTLFNQFRGWALGPQTNGPNRERPSYLQAWQVTQLFHPDAPAFLEQQRRRFILASAAEEAGLHVDREQVRSLAEQLDSLLGENGLPALEVQAEAELEVLARAGRRHFSRSLPTEDSDRIDAEAAARLAPKFGLEPRGALDKLLGLLERQGDLLQPWLLARALLFTEARDAALALAEAAFQVQRAWSAHSRGGRLTRNEVRRVAANIFGSSVEEAEAEGVRRGLLTHREGEASTGTLAEAVALVAAAERLPRPANDYPRRRGALPAQSLAPLTPQLSGTDPERTQ